MIAQIQMRRGTTAEWAAASPVVLAAGEPGWDSTLEGMKVGDGSTEWAALPWIDAKNRPDINADTLDGVHLADIRLGQNILHNWDFRNPVNQRGVSGAISTGSYFFDRWIRNSGTVTVAAGYLTLASGAVVEQRIEGNFLAGVICTVSFEVGGTIYHGSGAFPASNGTVPVEVDGYPDITFGCATGYMFVLIPATSVTSIKRFKCEMGTVSTLHLDPPMDHGVELAKCQRYLIEVGRIYSILSGYASSSTVAVFTLWLPTPLRIMPTLIGNNNFTIRFDGLVRPGIWIPNGSFSALPVINRIGILVTTQSSITAGHVVSGYFEDDLFSFLSAEL